MQFESAFLPLLIFAKAPEPGQVKTRLIPALGATGARDLYLRLLQRTLTQTFDWPGPRFLYATNPEHPVLRALASEHGLKLRQQCGEDLGERMANAIAEHYAPAGPSDMCPTAPVSVALALAEKLDTLAGFFAIDEKPTGSKDPFALRRAALGVIRLVLENGLRLPLRRAFAFAVSQYPAAIRRDEAVEDLLAFFADRLKVHLREQGVRHDLVSAVFALDGEDDLVRLLARVEALSDFVSGESGVNLMAGYKRASNGKS